MATLGCMGGLRSATCRAVPRRATPCAAPRCATLTPAAPCHAVPCRPPQCRADARRAAPYRRCRAPTLRLRPSPRRPVCALTLSKAEETMWCSSEDTGERLMVPSGAAQPFSFSRGLRGRCGRSITCGARRGRCGSPGAGPEPRSASPRADPGPGRERKQRCGLRPADGSGRVCVGRGAERRGGGQEQRRRAELGWGPAPRRDPDRAPSPSPLRWAPRTAPVPPAAPTCPGQLRVCGGALGAAVIAAGGGLM